MWPASSTPNGCARTGRSSGCWSAAGCGGPASGSSACPVISCHSAHSQARPQESRMQGLAWLGFTVGVALLLLTGSSVIKTLLIPRNLSSAISTAVARSVLAVYRLLTARTGDVEPRAQLLARGAPTY